MASYYVASEGKQTGPFEEAEILRRIEDGTLTSNDLCWREGMADWRPISTVLSGAAQQPCPPQVRTATPKAEPQAATLFLYIPVARLILMSIVSFGFYEAYWIYRNWRYLKERDKLAVSPFWRGMFGIFFCHSLLRRIHEDKEACSIRLPTFSPSGLATGWVVLTIVSNVVSRAPGITASVVAAFTPSFLCLIPVQSYINSVTEQRSPGQPYYRWSLGHFVCLVPGIIVWTLLLIGLVQSDK